MRKPIAVITDRISSTYEWLCQNHKVDRFDIANRFATSSETGQTYVLVLNKEQALAWEFSGMIISPFYESLENLVGSRIR